MNRAASWLILGAGVIVSIILTLTFNGLFLFLPFIFIPFMLTPFPRGRAKDIATCPACGRVGTSRFCPDDGSRMS